MERAGLERNRGVKSQLHLGRGMEKSEITSVKFQLARPGAPAVEGIPNDGNSQATRMRRVNSKLVGAPCQGLERHAGKPILNSNFFPPGNTDFPVNRVIDLHGSIVYIETKGEFEGPALLLQFSLEQRDIPFLRLTSMELNRNMPVGSRRARDNHQPRRIHIKPVHRWLFGASGIESPDPTAHAVQLVGATPGHRKHPALLVDHNKISVLVNDVEKRITRQGRLRKA